MISLDELRSGYEDVTKLYDDCIVRFGKINGKRIDPDRVGGRTQIYLLGGERNQIGNNLRRCISDMFRLILATKGYSNKFRFRLSSYVRKCSEFGIGIPDRIVEFGERLDSFPLMDNSFYFSENDLKEGLIVAKDLLDIVDAQRASYASGIAEQGKIEDNKNVQEEQTTYFQK